jgi:hypothetical protein
MECHSVILNLMQQRREVKMGAGGRNKERKRERKRRKGVALGGCETWR